MDDKDLLEIPHFLRNQKNLANEREQQEQNEATDGQSALTAGLGLVESLRTEADLCRNETADDIANLLDAAADTIDRLSTLFGMALLECGEDRDDGNAPGHAHSIPGVWDTHNGEKSGQPCMWCSMWIKAKRDGLTPSA